MNNCTLEDHEHHEYYDQNIWALILRPRAYTQDTNSDGTFGAQIIEMERAIVGDTEAESYEFLKTHAAGDSIDEKGERVAGSGWIDAVRVPIPEDIWDNMKSFGHGMPDGRYELTAWVDDEGLNLGKIINAAAAFLTGINLAGTVVFALTNLDTGDTVGANGMFIELLTGAIEAAGEEHMRQALIKRIISEVTRGRSLQETLENPDEWAQEWIEGMNDVTRQAVAAVLAEDEIGDDGFDEIEDYVNQHGQQ